MSALVSPRLRAARKLRVIVCAAAAFSLAGCAFLSKGEPVVEEREPGIFGEGGLLSIGSRGSRNADAESLGVNRYLWRASLDVLTASGLPLASSDPFGGAATTDWGALPGQPGVQFKVTAFVDSPELRVESLRVVVSKRDSLGRPAAVAPETARQIENAILSRARELRVAELNR